MVYYEYGVFGETVSSADGIPNPYQYNAEYTDAATGLQYLRARYYDSEINRFLTKDTYLGETNEPLTKNLYAYANNNPINLNDPSGHLFGLIMGIITVGVTIYSSYKAVKTHNQQSAQIRQSQSSYESKGTVQTGKISGRSYAAPTSANQTGSFSYYNARDNKTVTFTSAADYFAYKKLCDELDALDKNLASQIVHNTLDAVGVIPGVGEVADALNGVVYLAEGDKASAALSFVSCVPLAGDAIGKGAKNAGKLLGIASDSAKYVDDVAELGQTIAKNGDEVIEAVVKNSDEAIDTIKNTVKNSDGATDAVKSTVKNSEDSVQYIDERFVGSREFTNEELELLTSGNEVVEDVTKKVPNPYGKKGGPEHQAVTESIIKDMPEDSYQKEFKIVTENGDKNFRYADVVEFDNNDVSKIHQVGKVNKNGTPVSREMSAIRDIKATKEYKNTPVYFWPYNSDMGPIVF